jgi:uncharacterized protein YkwD
VQRLVVALTAALILSLVPAAVVSAHGCAGAGAMPNKHNAAKIRRATLCLVNKARAAHGLKRIRGNHKLARAARRHSLDMVRHGYFEHSSPSGGSTLVSRASAVHYLRRTAAWFLAENIAWGSGSLASPRATVRAWMHSPPHRENILSRRVHDAGVGVALGLPAGGRGATYTMDFGRVG